ncbi:MAG TPA: VWA domain-containing protein [Terriglobia bacterium]|nr:VWA domain-containing protein [Terriglobia bacterium]
MATPIKSWFVFTLLLFLAATSAWAGLPQELREAPPYTISLNVDLVLLDVSVVDRDGKFVADLEAGNFKIYEDGRAEEIAYFLKKDVPVTVGLAIDNSGSMRGKRAGIVAAAMSFVEASNPHDEMFVVHFNEQVRFGLSPPELFTNNPIQVRGALLRMISDGQTALYDAVSQAMEHFGKGRHNRKALLVVSDGGDNASQHGLKEVLQLVHSSQVVVYTISLYDPSNRDQKPRVLRRLSKTSGGESFFPKELEQVGPICHSIATDIRNQYLLAYRSSNTKRDGAFRQVRVLLDTPAKRNLVVRTREGYFAPSGTSAGRASIKSGEVTGEP